MNIETKLKKAIVKSITGKYLVYVIQLLSMVIMARLFTPEQFGLFAAIQVFALFAMLLGEMGFGAALINYTHIRSELRDSVFTFTWILGGGLCMCFLILSPLIVAYYDNTIYYSLVIPVAIGTIFGSAVTVPMASLQKEKRFISIAKCESISEILSLIFVVVMVSWSNSTLLLALKPMISMITRFILLWNESKKTPTGAAKFNNKFHLIKELLNFSLYQFGFNVINFFSRNLDKVFVGKYIGSFDLGIYDKAYQLMRYPLFLFTFAMAPALQPVLVEIKNDQKELQRIHNKFFKKLSIAGLAVGAFTFVTSDLIVYILLGDQWNDVASILRILSLIIPVQFVLSTSGGFYQATGRADLLFKCGVFSSIVNVIAMIIGVSQGNIEALSLSLCISFFINLLQCYWVMSKNLFSGGVSFFIKDVGVYILMMAGFIIFGFFNYDLKFNFI